jgi:hypothetical protein
MQIDLLQAWTAAHGGSNERIIGGGTRRRKSAKGGKTKCCECSRGHRQVASNVASITSHSSMGSTPNGTTAASTASTSTTTVFSSQALCVGNRADANFAERTLVAWCWTNVSAGAHLGHSVEQSTSTALCYAASSHEGHEHCRGHLCSTKLKRTQAPQHTVAMPLRTAFSIRCVVACSHPQSERIVSERGAVKVQVNKPLALAYQAQPFVTQFSYALLLTLATAAELSSAHGRTDAGQSSGDSIRFWACAPTDVKKLKTWA